MRWNITNHAEERLRERFPELGPVTLEEVLADAVPCKVKSNKGDQLWVADYQGVQVYAVVKHERGHRVAVTVLTPAEATSRMVDALDEYLEAEAVEHDIKAKAWLDAELARIGIAHTKAVSVVAALSSTLSRLRRQRALL